MRFSGVLQAVIVSLGFLGFTSALTYKGADLSSLLQVEKAGVTFKDTNGATGKLENILKTHGMNTVRIRLWTSGTYDLNFGLTMAKRVKAAGLNLVVDLHFSDTWADPGHQSIPAGWGSTVSSLNTNIYNYAKSVVAAFIKQGTPIDILALGNEINDGLLWPVGKGGTTAGWSAASQFLHSAKVGATDGGFKGKTMIHIANGWDLGGQQYFYNNIFVPGALSASDVDILAVSFYPFFGTGATAAALKSTLTALINTYGKDIIVAETDWPAVSCSTALSASFAKSPAGQISWQQSITSVLSALPGGHGKGTLYWEPGWIGNANLGSPCGDNLLFASNGMARSSVDIFKSM
ncbi:arabinogalactan endo-1,4-beta-galactosidase [Rickenella mellea]|uniref:Arabinogalactan endo-beta-1,4-galactanase n=1 Tax=Rickenella mellea TaxID=50990 RepID=A0A4Y7PQI0_9AGAM|nr:arabinogalactan endo-1,4-beta-galactosidase [Rickenella mellea]